MQHRQARPSCCCCAVAVHSKMALPSLVRRPLRTTASREEGEQQQMLLRLPNLIVSLAAAAAVAVALRIRDRLSASHLTDCCSPRGQLSSLPSLSPDSSLLLSLSRPVSAMVSADAALIARASDASDPLSPFDACIVSASGSSTLYRLSCISLHDPDVDRWSERDRPVSRASHSFLPPAVASSSKHFRCPLCRQLQSVACNSPAFSLSKVSPSWTQFFLFAASASSYTIPKRPCLPDAHEC